MFKLSLRILPLPVSINEALNNGYKQSNGTYY